MDTFVRNIEDRPKASIRDFIYVRDNTLSESFCNHVIERFNHDGRKQDGVVGQTRVDKNVKDTKDLKISGLDDWVEEDNTFYESLREGLDEYHEYLEKINEGICNAFPNTSFTTPPSIPPPKAT